MIVESGLLQQEPHEGSSKTTTVMAAALKETSTKVTVRRLERLRVEFLKSRKGTLACPQCKSRKTRFRGYIVVFDSHAMECESCGRLWKIIVTRHSRRKDRAVGHFSYSQVIYHCLEFWWDRDIDGEIGQLFLY